MTSNIRLRLETVDKGPVLVAHLSAMVVKHGRSVLKASFAEGLSAGDSGFYAQLSGRLGSDPLREGAEATKLLEGCKAKKPIATVLVDQAVVAGVGNIYRTEILYEAGIHPKQMANSLTEKEIMKIWNVAVKQMQQGFRTGSIWGTKKAAFCYGRKTSACGGKVKQLKLGGRAVYACGQRQVLDAKRAAPAAKLRRSGTAHLDGMLPAVKAENKKRKSGEGLAVQHVALKDDATRTAPRFY